MLIEMSRTAHERDNRWHAPGSHMKLCVHVFGKRTIQVLSNAATRNVGQRANGAGELAQDGANRLHVDAGGLEQRIEHALAAQRLLRHTQLIERLTVGNHLANQRIAVGVNSRGSQADKHVALLDLGRVEHFRTIYHAYAKTGKVILIGIHYTRMLSHFATDKSSARHLAAISNAGNDFGNRFALKFSDGNVIEEKQGLGACCKNVVHAHGDQVDAHGVMLASELSQLNLGANAVGTGNQNRICHVLRHVDGEQAAETADIAANLIAVRAMNRILDGVYCTGTLCRIYSRFGIGGSTLSRPAGPLGFIVIHRVDLNAISHSISWNSNPLFGGLQTTYCHNSRHYGMPSSWPLIEHCLPFGKEALGLHGIRNIHRVFAGKASVTETRVFALNSLVKALN